MHCFVRSGRVYGNQALVRPCGEREFCFLVLVSKMQKGMEKMWFLTDTAGKFREKHENQGRPKPNYLNTKAYSEVL